MLSTVAPDLPDVNCTQPRAFRDAFIAHAGVSYFRAATAKTVPSQRVAASELHEYEFYTPSKSVGSALVVDVDRPEAVLEIFEAIPAEISPSWVVETRRGAQAGWLIDPVDLRETAKEHPIRYAQAVGHALRAAVNGDEAVDPLTPSRVRNPAYERAELRAPATPPVYSLRELHQALKAADLWPQGPRLTGRTVHQAAGAANAAAITEGTRNQTIFDAARYAAYRGEDHAAVAWETNDAAETPLHATEVHGIIRSITRYMNRTRHSQANATVVMPSQMRDLLSEMGRRGGLANTAAQRAARALGTRASIAARKHRTDQKARRAQRMHTRGHTRGHIAATLGTSLPTLCRWLRRYVPHTHNFTNGASGGQPTTPPVPGRTNQCPTRTPKGLPRQAATEEPGTPTSSKRHAEATSHMPTRPGLPPQIFAQATSKNSLPRVTPTTRLGRIWRFLRPLCGG